MPAPDHIEIRDVRILAGAAPAISEAAGDLIAGLTHLANPADPAVKSLFSIHRADTDTGMSFGVSTVHGQITAVFDHAVKNDRLVGRYRFFALHDTPTGEPSATELWTLLFDVNHCAMWEPSDEIFSWQFAPGTYHTAQSLGEFVFRLLAKQQAALARY